MQYQQRNNSEMKYPVFPGRKESSVTVEQMAAAIRAAKAMDIKEKELVCDTIYATQPNLLGSVLALRSLGISMETIDIVLNILIVLHLTVAEPGQVLAIVSENDLDRELKRYTSSVKFSDGLDARSFTQSIEQTTAYKKERVLFAHVLNTLMHTGLVAQQDEKAKYPMLAAINLANCIARAKRLRRR
jgi:hypothetical protein